MGSHCVDCVRAAQPPARERVRRWDARQTTIVTNLIVAINVGIFVWESITGAGLFAGRSVRSEVVRDLALFGPAVADGQWYRLVTGGFLHAGILHVAFNMLIVFQLGQLLEPALGRVRFLALYLAALLAGSAGALVVEPRVFTVGASGAAFGLAGAAFVGLRQRGVDVWRTGLGPMLAFNLVFTFLVPGISVGGHLGGLAGGALVGAIMLRPAARRRGSTDLAVDLAVAGAAIVFSVAVALASAA